MKQPNFEWYVLNEERFKDDKFDKYPYTGNDIKPWNIFNNVHVYEQTCHLCQQYKTKKMTLEDFTEELRKIIQWQEWSRVEYEIMVAPVIGSDYEKGGKIDCYQQVLPNIDILAKYVLNTYYPRLKV